MEKLLHQRVLSDTAVPGGRRLDLEVRLDDDWVPGALLLPAGRAAPGAMPAALLLHGYSADKEMMAGTIGRALAKRGIASLALDLPLHGERRAAGSARPSPANVMELVRHWRAALAEGELGLSYLGARAEIDRARLAAVGYSLGSYLCGALAARDPRVRALVLAAGGDLPPGPLTAFARPIMDPLENMRALDGRPLLMVAGRRDRTVTPAQAEALFAAASQPKEIRWYDSGHILPVSAATDVADWLRDRL
jgi:fermentation-respiration switch protein FrsA (DUF1100 family)